MKYRVLTTEELGALEDDLKAFLIVNGIDGSEWEKINQTNPDKAIQLVELFSDLVLDKTYEKIKFLEFRSKNILVVFHVLTKEIISITLTLDNQDLGDFSTIESIHKTFVEHASNIKYQVNTKIGFDNRNLEVHKLLESGCVLSAEEFWVSLTKAIDLKQDKL
ncbi:MAG TPA: DUF6495 family protein [Taishania sp.]|nr:DUF6495 family protein [Taishania sp.]